MSKDIIATGLGSWASELTVGSIILRLMLSVVFAVIIGCERATKRHAAGVRTFMLVALASTLSAFGDLYFIKELSVSFSFLSASVVIGIAVISCNTILFSSKNQLKGLTTSVCLWINGINSVIIGLGLYFVGLVVFVIQMIAVVSLPKVEERFKKRSDLIEVHIELKSKNFLQDFTYAIRKFGIKVISIESNPAYANSGLGVYSVMLGIKDKELKGKTHAEIIEVLSTLECVNYIEEME